MALGPDISKPSNLWDITQNRQQQLARRRRYFVPRNQGLLSAFTACCCLVFMMTFLETSRVLIPSKVVSKRDLHLLTEGFTNDLQVKEGDDGDTPLSAQRPHRPGAVVVGFSHCGAYAILSALSVHPHLVVNKKNVYFFSGNQTTEWYLSQMPPSLDHQTTVDLSTSTIQHKAAIKRLKAFNETVRIIVVICDPVARMLNKYLAEQKHQSAKTRLEKLDEREIVQRFIDTIFTTKNGTIAVRTDLISGVGDYFKHFIDLYQAFPRRQVHVVEQRRFFDNPSNELSKLHKFLRVTPLSHIADIQYDSLNNKLCYNASVWRRMCVPEIFKNVSKIFVPEYNDHLRKLRQFFAPFNKRLYIYLEHSFGWL